MNKRIQQRVSSLVALASNMNKDKRRDYNSRLKSFLDKIEKLDKMNNTLFNGNEKVECMSEIWDMYHDTLKHLAMFYTASKWLEDIQERHERSECTKQVFIDGVKDGDILDVLHTNLALEHMSNDGFYRIAAPKKQPTDSMWHDESWNRNTDNSGTPESISMDDMSDSSLEAMLSSYAVTFDNIENEYDRELQYVPYLDRKEAATYF